MGRQHALIVILRYSLHALVGTIMFAIVAAPAVMIDIVVQHLARNGTSQAVLIILSLFEYFLLTFDALISAAYIAYSALTIFKESCDE
jgi:hypothetical protein